MKLNEAEAKKIFSEAGIATPKGIIVSSTSEAGKVAASLKSDEVMLKSLILVGGRGKAGAILKTDSKKAAEKSKKLLGKKFKGLTVKKILVEEAVKILREFYLGITFDRSKKSWVLIFSPEGGVEIEQLAETHPEKILKFWFHLPLEGKEFSSSLQSFFREHPIDERLVDRIVQIASKLSDIVIKKDCTLAEINPLIQTPLGLVAADAKIILDDNALYRHKEWLAQRHRTLTENEKIAFDSGIQYVELDGTIGVIGNGAGLVMATLDVLDYYGGKPANFCDVGGGANTDTVIQALKIVRRTKPKVMLVNIFGGITQVDLVAEGIVKFRKQFKSKTPMVVRVEGRNRIKGKKFLNAAGIQTLDTIEECAEAAVKLEKGKK